MDPHNSFLMTTLIAAGLMLFCAARNYRIPSIISRQLKLSAELPYVVLRSSCRWMLDASSLLTFLKDAARCANRQTSATLTGNACPVCWPFQLRGRPARGTVGDFSSSVDYREHCVADDEVIHYFDS